MGPPRYLQGASNVNPLLPTRSFTASAPLPPASPVPPWPSLVLTYCRGASCSPPIRPIQPDYDPGVDLTRGWQRNASRAIGAFGDKALRHDPDPVFAALLDSQAGPYAARVFTARPTAPELTLPSSLFRVLVLRRLRMLLLAGLRPRRERPNPGPQRV